MAKYCERWMTAFRIARSVQWEAWRTGTLDSGASTDHENSCQRVALWLVLRGGFRPTDHVGRMGIRSLARKKQWSHVNHIVRLVSKDDTIEDRIEDWEPFLYSPQFEISPRPYQRIDIRIKGEVVLVDHDVANQRSEQRPYGIDRRRPVSRLLHSTAQKPSLAR